MKPQWVIVLMLGLAGCATDGHETITTVLPQGIGNGLVKDAVKQLLSLYPPGRTKFILGQPLSQTDSFGTALVKALREQGYAIETISPVKPAEAPDGLAIRYVIDQPETKLVAHLYRLKLNVGNAVMTRAYAVNNQSAKPAGAWAVLE